MQRELLSNNSIMTQYVGNQKMLTDCWENNGESGGEGEQKESWGRGLAEMWKRSTSLRSHLLSIILLGKINMHVINSWIYFNVVASSASEHSDE